MPESELIELDGKAWCRFHLPLRVGAVDSEKTRWSTAQCAAFNQTVLDLIEEAKKKEEVADLSGVVFPTDISLACEPKEQSPLPAVFIQAIFGGRADFRHVVFPRHRSSMPSFDLATFTKIARFDRATFCDVAAFENVTFADRTSFDAATFEKNAHFHSASFAKEASFSDAVFRGNVEFHHANFGDVVWFSRSKFAWSIYFRDAIFGGDFHFEGDTSLGYADAIPGLAAFHRATFARRAIFNNRSFLNTTEFGGAIFEVAPEFHNSVFHQDTSFAGTQFRDREGLHGVDSARAYRTLKLAMESVRARSEESQFYAYEQHALRGRKDAAWSVKLFSWLYETTADYGQSFLRAFAWVLSSFWAFFLVYLAALTDTMITWGEMADVLQFALRQVFHPFAAFRPPAAPLETNVDPIPLWLAFVAALHSILTFVFLGLALLALRRRFRLN